MTFPIRKPVLSACPLRVLGSGVGRGVGRGVGVGAGVALGVAIGVGSGISVGVAAGDMADVGSGVAVEASTGLDVGMGEGVSSGWVQEIITSRRPMIGNQSKRWNIAHSNRNGFGKQSIRNLSHLAISFDFHNFQ